MSFSSSQDIINQGVVEVCDRNLYDLARDRAPNEHGPLDPRMGISAKAAACETCGEPLQTCNGHFGHVKLALPVLHIGYFKMIVAVLQNICKVIRITDKTFYRLTQIRDVLESFYQSMTVDRSFVICADPTLTIYGKLRLAKRSMSNAEKLGRATRVE